MPSYFALSKTLRMISTAVKFWNTRQSAERVRNHSQGRSTAL